MTPENLAFEAVRRERYPEELFVVLLVIDTEELFVVMIDNFQWVELLERIPVELFVKMMRIDNSQWVEPLERILVELFGDRDQSFQL